ncbi:MAG: hypothetical protein LBB49_03885 [Gracilibacteraceae bacterium]|jgi:hypothetical protein|nr:hypothetical protein [Gracilibacteraceae bacterium]
MLTTEFKLEDAIEVWKEEGREDGIVISEARGEAHVIALLESGYSLDEVRETLRREHEKNSNQ